MAAELENARYRKCVKAALNGAQKTQRYS